MGKISVRPSAIVLKDGKLLVVKSEYNGQTFYLLPGGGIEEGETILQCAERETREETNIIVKAKKLTYLNDFIPEGGHCLNVYILAEVVSGSKATHEKDPDLKKGNVKKAEWKTLAELENLDFRPKELIKRIIRDAPKFSSENNYFLG